MTANLETELLELEKSFWCAMRDKDVDRAMELTNDQCVVTGAQGVSKVDRATMGKMLETGSWQLHDFDFEDVKVEQLSDDVAVIAYKVREKLTVDGVPLEMTASDSSAWVRKDGKWLCALHTESVEGDPYGRDRQTSPVP
jgi:hypothetical protein